MSGGRLAGKTAIITGASTGLGPVMAKRFVDEGARVLLSARREELVAAAAEAYWNATIAIRCSCIVPGSIDTELWQNWVRRTADEQDVDFETNRARLLSGVALRDISPTTDVANAALFLVSDESRTITGQSVVDDAGGYMLG